MRNGHTGRILWLTGLSGAGMPAGQFTEVYVITPREVCEERDTKGRAGELNNFTSIPSPYE